MTKPKPQRRQHRHLSRDSNAALRASLLSASLLVLMPQPAHAVELWQGFSAGMSKQKALSRYNEKVTCEKEFAFEWCRTKPYLTLGNDQAKVTLQFKENKLIRLGLAVNAIKSCTKTDFKSLNENKERVDCIKDIERRDKESLILIRQALMSKYGKNYENDKDGNLTWRYKGILIQIVYVDIGLFYVNYEVDKTYESL